MTEDILQRYKRAEGPLPKTMLIWPLYGAGSEKLGREGKPVRVSMPHYNAEELLVRHDAVGLCFSDIKVIHIGPDHPRLVGREMQREPVVLGHEVTMTVVGVGACLQNHYHIGDRFIIQADIYYQGRGMAYGYVLQGGLSQYATVGKEILYGDEGCYLLPVQPETGYAEAALTEPWACVEAAYNICYRERLKDGGVAWFLGCGEDGDAYRLNHGLGESSHPCKIVATNLPGPFANLLRYQAETLGIEWVAQDDLTTAINWSPFDDIVVLGATEPIMVEETAKHLAKGGILNLVAPRLGGKVHLDVGRLHYDHITFVGTTEEDIFAAYRPIRSKLLQGGLAWFLGAAGPMGHMHVQRAIEMEGGPRKIVATNMRSSRILELERKFGAAARERGIELACLTEGRMGREAYYERLWEESEERGFDDIVVLAPSVEAIERAADYLAPGGVMNVFAGLPRGTKAAIDVSAICARNVRFVGSSGSAIADLRHMLALTESGVLSPNRSVAAVAGMEGALDGLQAVAEGRFPGKVVVFPQIVGLPLTPLSELRKLLPNVYVKLGEGEVWTKEAEKELLTMFLSMER